MSKECLTATCKKCGSLIGIELELEDDLFWSKDSWLGLGYEVKRMDFGEARHKLKKCVCSKSDEKSPCHYCGNALDIEKVWSDKGFSIKCCSGKCLALSRLNVRVESLDKTKRLMGELD